MTIQQNDLIKFNKTNLHALVSEGRGITVKDTVVTGLKFKVGKNDPCSSLRSESRGRRVRP